METFNKDQGARLREARLALGKSQKQLAKDMRITAAYLCDMEKGKTKPGTLFLLALQSSLKISEAWILEKKGPMFLEGTSEVPLYRGELPSSLKTDASGTIKLPHLQPCDCAYIYEGEAGSRIRHGDILTLEFTDKDDLQANIWAVLSDEFGRVDLKRVLRGAKKATFLASGDSSEEPLPYDPDSYKQVMKVVQVISTAAL